MVETTYQRLCEQFQKRRYDSLRSRLQHQPGWSQQRANYAVNQYLKFLAIASQHRQLSLVPTQDIDCAWEADILQNTQQYMQTCQQLCGEVIHHANTAELAARAGFSGMEVGFEQTQQLFSRYFGEAAQSSFPSQAAACGLL